MTEHRGKFYSPARMSEITGIKLGLIKYWKRLKKIPFFQEEPGAAVLLPYDGFMAFLEKNLNEISEEIQK